MSLMLPYNTQVTADESIIVMPLSMPQGNTCTAKDDCGRYSSIISNNHGKKLGFSASLRQVEAVIVVLRYGLSRWFFSMLAVVAQDPVFLLLCAYAPALPIPYFLARSRPDLDIIAANKYQR